MPWEWAEVGRLGANSQKVPEPSTLPFPFYSTYGKMEKHNPQDIPEAQERVNNTHELQFKILLSNWAISPQDKMSSYYKVHTFFCWFLLLWDQNQISSFVFCLSSQEEYCKLAGLLQ